MSLSIPALALLSLTASTAWAQSYTATYLPSNAPDHSEQGQSGTNRCGTTSSQTSNCQNAYLNAVDDFCLWAPPEPGAGSVIGNTEGRISSMTRIEVAWCLRDGTGARLIPDGAIQGVQFLQTSEFVQVTGVGDLTKLNIPAGDEGGELDPHGADGNGNPIGGLVFSTAFGPLQQVHEWTNFMSATEFCFRACNPASKNAPTYCQHIYDTMGCDWNMPASGYQKDVFEHCQGEPGEPMGVYGTSTFHQGDPATPAAHAAPASSACTTVATVGTGGASTPASTTAVSASATSSSAPSSSGSSAASSGSSSGSASASSSGSTSAKASSSQSASGSASTIAKTTAAVTGTGTSAAASSTTSSASGAAGARIVGGQWVLGAAAAIGVVLGGL
ncbi:hypothetical protein PLICRDRAFT_55877 [Plicaturopsis crispa FD-325 SS-3]|nr:hypothetical protein PLICRDRAFT_55877 [Plicaturopsis crispa FD-325 SS-3]